MDETRYNGRTFANFFEAFAAVCGPEDTTACWDYFKAAGYVSSQCRNALSSPRAQRGILTHSRKFATGVTVWGAYAKLTSSRHFLNTIHNEIFPYRL